MLLEYNAWANHRVLDAAARLTAEQYARQQPRLSFASVRGSLVHVLSAEVVWHRRYHEGVSPIPLLREADFPTVPELRARWHGEEAAARRFLADLPEGGPARQVQYTRLAGLPGNTPLWQPSPPLATRRATWTSSNTCAS